MEHAKLLSLKAAARALGVKPESLQAEADAGRVPHTRIGADYLFSLAALESVLSARAAGERGNGKAVRHDR
jgi:hypothetical protein